MNNYKLIHILLLPIAIIGLLGYSLTLLVYAQFLGVHDIIINTLELLISNGIYIVNMVGGNIQMIGAESFFAFYFGFVMIPLILIFWCTFLLGGWFYEFSDHNKPAIKTIRGWFLAFIYYPMITFGLITVFLLSID